MAALASALMPGVSLAGVRQQTDGDTPGRDDIDHAVIQDVGGKLYDVTASETKAGRTWLAARVKAAYALASAREPGGLGFAMDRVLAFSDGEGAKCPTGSTAVMVSVHQDGAPRALERLSLDDCASMGTAIGAIHRLNPSFLAEAGYPSFSTGQIRAQLVAWIKRLQQAGHVPAEITSSWARIVETEGLWSFSTCMVHGGFADGDVRFSGSTVTAVNNWNDMQVNDPARDLGWIFSRLDEDHRNAVLTAYGRMMGNRLDDLIMLRANLWVQMEQVGDFIQALNRADTDRIVQFRAQVDRLAHQLGVVAPASGAHGAAGRAGSASGAGSAAGQQPSTLTVGTLLEEGERRRAAAKASAGDLTDDSTNDADRTGSARIAAVPMDSDALADVTGESSITTVVSAVQPRPASSGLAAVFEAKAQTVSGNGAPAAKPTTAATMALRKTDDTTGNARNAREPREQTATIAIPLLEREERALRDAHAGIAFPPSSSQHQQVEDDQTGETDATGESQIDATGESRVSGETRG